MSWPRYCCQCCRCIMLLIVHEHCAGPFPSCSADCINEAVGAGDTLTVTTAVLCVCVCAAQLSTLLLLPRRGYAMRAVYPFTCPFKSPGAAVPCMQFAHSPKIIILF
eukprot:scpid78373/ scgid27751/ 